MSTPTSPPSIAQQMLSEGSLPDMPDNGVPMRAVVTAASTMNPDAEAHAQQLSQQTGMGVDLVRNNPQAAQQRATAADLDRRELEIRNPILASQLRDPNFAGLAHDDLDSLSRIDEGASTLSAYTPTWRDKITNASQDAFEAMGGRGSLKNKLFQFPLARVGIDALQGTESFAGNVGSFLGWHGNNPGRLNPLQTSAQSIEPAAFGTPATDLDKMAQLAGPIVPTMGIGGGASLIGRTLGLSENAAKVLAAVGTGSAFSADQGGATLTQMAGAGKSDADARHAANVVAGLTLVPNVAMGLTDFIPGLNRSPLLASVGMGGATGATGQLAQNVVTGQPLSKGVGSGALQGAAVMGGMHLGLSAFGSTMEDLVDAADSSKLRIRSPEAFQKAMEAQFEGQESLRIPAQDFVNYFHGKQLDPAEMANRVGATNLEEAAAAGSDLEIPKANFFGQLDPEHQKGLLPDLVDPATELTGRQAEAGKAELDEWSKNGGVEKLQAEFASADAETQATPEWKQVYSDLKQRYVDAGETGTAADSYATLHANAMANLAKKAGLKPDELLAMHNPNVTAGDAPGAIAEPAISPLHQQAIDDIRSVVEASQQTGQAPQKAVVAPADSWLVGAAKDHGLDLEGYQHVIDGSAVRHVISRHGNEKTELSRGQLPVTHADFEKIPSVLASPDAVIFGTKTKGKRDQIGYIKRLEDGTTLHLEEVRTGKKELAAVSMRKYPAAKDFDAIAGTLPSNARSDGGNEPIVVLHPNADKGVSTGDVLHQAKRSDDLQKRMALNLETARIQGEMVKRTPETNSLEHAKESTNAAPGHFSLKGEVLSLSDPITAYADSTRPEEIKAGTAIPSISRRMEIRTPNGRTEQIIVPGDTDPALIGKAVNVDASMIFGDRLWTDKVSSAEQTKEESTEGNRGWFRILPDGRYEIGKTKIGDFSTFIHEPAHAYLEMFRELTQRAGASDALKDDFKKITDWLDTTPEEAHKNGFTREQHEQWARANEQYVREGNAPTSGLKRAFQHFAVWLGSVYRRASSLGVELNSDIRGVMDRLYAGDDAVNRAEQEAPQQLFSNPEEAGWTDAEYKNYAESKGLEVTEAKTQLLREMHEAWLRERTQEWREEKGNVRDAVTQEIDARPEYSAIRSLRRGKLDDGTELTLNRDELVKQFGEERVKALQKLHPGLYRQEGGTDAETAAELFGYGSGEEMFRGLEGAPRRSAAIETATRDYMAVKHGDIRYDGSLDDKARLAMENDERAKNLHGEVGALRARVAVLEKRAADMKAAMRSISVAPIESYRETARAMVDGKAIADLQPNRYLNASRMFSREAFDSLRKGDVQRAAEAKNKELLNHFLFREASAARDYADKFESYAKRMQKPGPQQKLGLAQESSKVDYRDQFNWLLARYKLGAGPVDASGRPSAPERSLRAWAEEVYGVGNEPAIAPGILNENKFADYRNVPLSEVRDLHDALINVRHLAMREFKMYVQGKQVDFAEAKNAMMESARENLRSKPEKTFEYNRSVLDRAMDPARYVDARLIRMERMIEWLDGGKAGPWHENVWNLASDAQGDEYALQHDVTHTVTDALADMPDEMRRRLWTEKVSVEGIREPLERRSMLSIAFNMGNEGNLDRLRRTFIDKGWDPEAIRKIGGMLTHEEWSFVQRTWDSLKPLGVRMQDLEKRLTGLPPAMVKVTPFKVALDDGTEIDLAGGYFPIVMDPLHSQRAIEQDAKATAQNAMQSGYVRATTAKGYTKERTGYGGPLLLDYEQAMTSHVAKVAKDLSHREFMLSTQRLLLDTDVRKTLRETLGPQYEKQFMPWLRTIINDNNGSVQEGTDGMKDAMQKLRGNVVAASVGFNASTSLLQISHAPRMMLYAKPASLAQALGDFLARPIEATREIRELSPSEMRFRGDNLDRDVRAVLQKPDFQAGYTRKVGVAARFALEVMDHLFSHTLWRAAYNDALDKYSDLPEGEASSKAVHEADSAVRLGLGTSAPKDLPAIMRNNEFNKFITTLYGFHSGVYNQLRDIGHQFRYDRNVGKLTYAGILTAVLPAVLGSLLTGQRPKDGENPGWWAAKKALLFSADTVPILRAVASAIDGGHDVQFSPIESLMTKGAKDAIEISSDKEDKDWLGIGLDAGETAGATLGIPGSHQVVKTLRYVHRANEGKIEDPNWWNALVGGR